jgi:hypothetical protein
MKYLIASILLFFCSCNRHTSENFVDELYIDLDRNEKLLASDFIEKADVIKLETNESCLIGEISKIQYIDDRIYILDMLSNALFVFNKEGGFEDKFHKPGNGPGEYTLIMDFLVHNDRIYILDYSKMCILEYDQNMEFINSVKYETLSSEFKLIGNIVYLYNEPSGNRNDFYFSSIELGSGKVEHHIHRPFLSHKYNWAGTSTLAISDELIYASPRHGNIIYRNENNDFVPAYRIRFSKGNFPEGENINDYDKSGASFPYIVREHFFVSDKYLITDYFHNGMRSFCFYDKNTKNIHNGIIENNLLDNFRFFPRWSNGDFLIEEVAAPYVVESFMFLATYNDKIKETKEEDNPVVVIYSIKR